MNIDPKKLTAVGLVINHSKKLYNLMGPAERKEFAGLLIAIASLLTDAAKEVWNDSKKRGISSWTTDLKDLNPTHFKTDGSN